MPIEPGRIYPTRGGLSVLIMEPFQIAYDVHGSERQTANFWKGFIVEDDPPTPGLWYENGQYSPVKGVKMPLDLIDDAGNSPPSEGTP